MRKAALVLGVCGLLVLAACEDANTKESSLRFGMPTATLEPEEGSVEGELVVRGSTVVSFSVLDETLTAFDLSTGAEAWVVPELENLDVWVGSDFVALQPDDKSVEVRELETGELRHDIPLKPEESVWYQGRLVGVSDDVVLIALSNDDRQKILSGFDATSGKKLWTVTPEFPHDFWSVKPIGAEPSTSTGYRIGHSSLKLASDAPVFAASFSNHQFETVGIDARTGEERWTVDIGNPTEAPHMDWSGDGIASAVSKASDSSEERTLLAVDVESGAREETVVSLAGYSSKRKRWGPTDEEHPGVRVSGGFVFAQDSHHRPRVTELRTGKPVWTAAGAGVPLGYDDGVAVYRAVGSKGAGDVVAVDVQSRKVLWKSAEVIPDLNSIIVDGQLLVSVKHGVKVYDVKTGKAQWKFWGKLLGWNNKSYVFKKNQSDQAVKVVALDGK